MMAYLRSKEIRGEQYLYLVRSVWDPGRSTSRQEIIKYLGKASLVTRRDIPERYRNDRGVRAFLSSYRKSGDPERPVSRFRRGLLGSLRRGDLDGALDTYREFRKSYGIAEFYENVLRPVMYDVGELWTQGKISIATEHICSNVAQGLVGSIKAKKGAAARGLKVIICTPSGEEHCIGCGVLESYLSGRGFRILNLSPSAPAESILSAIRDEKPDAVLVSITLDDSIRSGQRLVGKIMERHDVPVVVGGRAADGADFGAEVRSADSLRSVLRLLRSSHAPG